MRSDARDALGLTDQTVDLVGLLRLRAERLGRQRAFTFLIDGESQRTHITYGQLDLRARAIAAHLQAQGMAGERALLLYPSGLEFIAAFFGCLYAGVVAVPAYPPRRNRNLQRIQSIVGDAGPKIALTTEDVFGRVEPVLADMPDLASIPWTCTREISSSVAHDWSEPSVAPETLAFLQYTSGSTGAPKGVMLSHGNLLHNTEIISAAFRPSYASSGVTWLPLYHDMGLIGGVVQPIYFGRPMTVMTPTHFLQQPLRWLRAISDTGALISGGPNFAYELCVERVTEEEKRTLDLSQWELAFNGAEPVRAETIDRFSAAFAECGFRREAFYPCYGLAEATLMVAGGDKNLPPPIAAFDGEQLQAGTAREVDPSVDGAVRLVGSGSSLLGQQIVIADPEQRTECAAGNVGEIWVSGPSVAQGYWRREEVSEETFGARLADGRGPFLRTGDLGCFSASGELFINGRLKDLIIVRGVNHYPQDIELTVEKAHDDLRPASGAAFSIGDHGAEQLVVVQEVVRKRDIDYDSVCAAVRSEIAKTHEVGVHAVVLIKPNSIPKTSSGKIQRHACRNAYLAGELAIVAEASAEGAVRVASRSRRRQRDAIEPLAAAPASKSAPQPEAEREDLVPRVLKVIQAVAQERAAQLTMDTDIAGMGLDSLERMEIVADLEKEFGVRFSEEAILSMETCQDVIEQVKSHLRNRASDSGNQGSDANAQPEDGVPRSDYVFTESLEYRRLQATIDMATDEAGLTNPYFTEHEGVTGATTTIGGKQYVNFCSYNYIGMSGDPAVHQGAKEAIDRYGTSTSASRVVSGEKTIHRVIEGEVADFLGVEAAVLFAGGHATNETVIGHLFGPGDLILHDALAHNSIVQGCKLSGAVRRAFPHNDWRACGEMLKRYRKEHRRVLIAIEGVYSMDGDYCDLPRFVELKKKHRAYLYLDEAHSIGAVGATGRGMTEMQSVDPRDVDFLMGTTSKALGSIGGFIAASDPVVQYLKYTTPGFVFAGGATPPSAGAALAALRLLKKEPERIARLHENAALFARLASEAGFDIGNSGGTPIVPVITGNSVLALALSNAMFAAGVNVQPILHPAVEEEKARLRFFITSLHTEDQIRSAVEKLIDAREAISRGSAAGINGRPRSEPKPEALDSV